MAIIDKRRKKDPEREARIKEKVAENLAAFKKHLDQHRPLDEDTPSEYVNNDSDGVACRLASDIEEFDRQQFEKLVQNNLFNTESQKPVEEIVIDLQDINQRQGVYGFTPLHQAVKDRNVERVKALLALGARHDIKDNAGITPKERAYNSGFDEIVRLFEPGFIRKEPIEFMDDD